MPNSRQTSVMASPSRSRATKRRRSSITELAFHGIHTSHRTKAESVTHVSGTFCHLCLRPLIHIHQSLRDRRLNSRASYFGTKRRQNAPVGAKSPEIVPKAVLGPFAAITQRDDGFWSIGWHDEAPGPFETFQFAAAVCLAGART